MLVRQGVDNNSAESIWLQMTSPDQGGSARYLWEEAEPRRPSFLTARDVTASGFEETSNIN